MRALSKLHCIVGATCWAILMLVSVACSAAAPTSAVPLGLWVGGPEDAGFNAAWDNFVHAMGSTPQFNITYVDPDQRASTWASYASYEAGVMAGNPRTAKAIPFIGWGLGTMPDGNLFAQIAQGQYDDQITGALANWKLAGYDTLYLRPGWEMNLFFPWKVSKNNAGGFVAAFKHFVTVVRSHAASHHMKIFIVWNPNVAGNQNDGSVTVSDVYPGAAFVDILAIDFYSQPIDSGWQRHPPTGRTADSRQYWVSTMIDMAVRDHKPIAFGEIGGTNPAFIRSVIDAMNSRPDNVQIALMGVWNTNDSNGSMSFTNPGDNRSDVLAAWRAGFGQDGSVRNQAP